MNKVICIMGPTGSGKTAQSLAMAKAGLPVCIINADSRQLYKDFPIISAQPDTEQKKQVRQVTGWKKRKTK